MNYQQWQSLDTVPIGRPIAVNANAYIFPGVFYRRPNDDLYVVGPYGKIYEAAEIKTWSWSETEPVAEMLVVKPHGIFCAHWWNEIGHLLNIIAENEINLFVEIGVLDGGLSALLVDRTRYVRTFWYVGVDLPQHLVNYLDPRVGLQCLTSRRRMLHADAWQPETVARISKIIKGEGWENRRAMIYCDGGDKPREAHLYWDILRPGDLLGVHDYSDDPNSKGPEVFPADVSDIIAAGRRRGAEALADTRILLMEKT